MNPRKILVVDDDQEMLLLLHRLLSEAGFEVVVAAEGVSALAAARAERPDAIVLDVGLPAGDGLSVLQRIRRTLPLADIPVMLVTARDGEISLEARAPGADGLMRRPVDPHTLVERLKGLLLAA